MKLFRRSGDGTFADQLRRRACRISLAASTWCRPTTTTTAAETCWSCAAAGSWRSASRCCATTATARSPTSPRPAAWPARRPARRRPCGPISTTTAGSTCSSATRKAPRSSSATAVTAPSRTSPPRPASRAAAFTKAVAAADYDNDGFPDLYVSNLGGGNFLYRNNRNRTFTEVAAAAGVPGRRSRIPGVVLRLRQRRLGRPVRQQLLPLDRRDCAVVPRAAARTRIR